MKQKSQKESFYEKNDLETYTYLLKEEKYLYFHPSNFILPGVLCLGQIRYWCLAIFSVKGTLKDYAYDFSRTGTQYFLFYTRKEKHSISNFTFSVCRTLKIQTSY